VKGGSLTVVAGYVESRDIEINKLVIGSLKKNLSLIARRSSQEEPRIFDVRKSKPELEAWWDTIDRKPPLDSSGCKM